MSTTENEPVDPQEDEFSDEEAYDGKPDSPGHQTSRGMQDDLL